MFINDLQWNSNGETEKVLPIEDDILALNRIVCLLAYIELSRNFITFKYVLISLIPSSIILFLSFVEQVYRPRTLVSSLVRDWSIISR